jgi:ABC-2 type transport system permease protein
MTKALAVAKWEYLQKLRSKAFLVSLFLMPIIIVAFGFLPTLFATQEDKETKVVGIIDLSGDLAEPLTNRMQSLYTLANGQPNYLLRTIAKGEGTNLEDAVATATKQVARDEIEGYIIIKPNIFSDSVVEYRSRSVGDFRLTSRIEENLREVLTERRLVQRGLDPKLLSELRAPLDLRTIKIGKSGETEEGGFATIWFTAYVFLMMLLFMVQTSGQLLVRSFIEEKSNRIVEVLVSSCSPTTLMTGKVLGLSALGLTQLGFWGLIALAVTAQFGIQNIALGQAALQLVYFVLGYLFYAAVFIAAGSPLTTEQEAQQVTSYLTLILIIPLVIALPAMQNPNAPWIRVLTFIPFLTAPMMAVRIPVQIPSTVEIMLTVALLALSIYVAMWVAGRIFRVAILATGKRPRLNEVIRWVRTG